MHEISGEGVGSAVKTAVGRVFRRALEKGAPEPGRILIEDEKGRWIRRLRSLPLHERKKTVLVYFSPASLDPAGRMFVGGAMAAPPSLVETEKVCRAVETARSRPSPIQDFLLEDPGNVPTKVFLRPRNLMKRVLGLRGIMDLLSDLAANLDAAAVVDSSPALLVWDREKTEIRQAWEDAARPVWADQSHLGFDDDPDHGPGIIEGMVAMLPDGRVFDLFSFQTRDGHWRFEGRKGTLPECHDPEKIVDMPEEILRIPSWVACDLDRPASPGVCLLDESARAAEHSGKMLWISNIGQKQLAPLLALGTPVLIDGPVLAGIKNLEQPG